MGSPTVPEVWGESLEQSSEGTRRCEGSPEVTGCLGHLEACGPGLCVCLFGWFGWWRGTDYLNR